MNGLRREIRDLLNIWGLPAHEGLFHGEGLALVANLANLSAKVISEDFYDLKVELVNLAVRENAGGWLDFDSGIAYCETGEGQVSFHLFDDIWSIFDPMRTPDVWEGPGGQDEAPERIARYLGIEYVPQTGPRGGDWNHFNNPVPYQWDWE